jgi:predicted AAA+ superfamily ATPase
VEFFRRTYLTESLKGLLVGAMHRLTGRAATRSCSCRPTSAAARPTPCWRSIHLFSGTAPTELAGIDGVMQEAGVDRLPKARRAVLVGNKISPGNPITKADGTVVHTLWGELAWQLGGREAFDEGAARRRARHQPG